MRTTAFSNVQLNRLDFPDQDRHPAYRGLEWLPLQCLRKEPETVEWIRSFDKGSIFWDVGASVGPYTMIASALGHAVYAFEPNGPSYGELCQNLLINDIHATPLPVALSTGERIQQQYVHTWAAGAGGQSLTKPLNRSLPVLISSADDMVDTIGVPDYVKIDVDGGEIEVIESGRNLWPLVRSMMVEVSRGTKDDIGLILSACGLMEHKRFPRSGDEFNFLYVREE